MIDAVARPSLPKRTLRRAADTVLPSTVLVRRGPGDRRRLALTFDDGPDALTRDYLDALDRFSARATFFVVGEACRARPDDLLEILRRGHEVAGHGFTHRRFPELDRAALDEELRRTAALLPPPIGRPMVRPPSGSITLRSLLRTARAGYVTALWSLDSDDWRIRDAAAVATRVAPERVAPGEIVLLHEGQRWTLEALPAILGGLAGAGFELVTVSELLRP